MEQRRIESTPASNMAGYYRLRQEDFPKWQAQRRSTKQRTVTKALDSKRFHCAPCGRTFQDSSDLNIHKNTQTHISKTTGVGRVYKYPVQSEPDAANRASRKYYCAICKYPANSQSALVKHNGTNKHQKNAQAAEEAASAS